MASFASSLMMPLNECAAKARVVGSKQTDSGRLDKKYFPEGDGWVDGGLEHHTVERLWLWKRTAWSGRRDSLQRVSWNAMGMIELG
jgi:hypothetical protein